jgi:hypothetical protein
MTERNKGMDGSGHSTLDVQWRGIYRSTMAFCKGEIRGDLIQINFGCMLVLENVSGIPRQGFEVDEAVEYQPRGYKKRGLAWHSDVRRKGIVKDNN